jgi:predicted HD superfamily hydrolase involved in NAD metabolism
VNRFSDLAQRARGLLRDALSEASLAHCERVAATARALAGRFGVDQDTAELAGLLHDYARDEGDEALLAAADEFGLPILPVERERPYLLHARVAAARLRRDLPGVDKAVLAAVEAHTVGAVPMSDVGKVVYLADMLEPARSYPGVEALRASCARDGLAECFRGGYATSVRRVRESGAPLHPVSSAVLSQIERETGRPMSDAVARR